MTIALYTIIAPTASDQFTPITGYGHYGQLQTVLVGLSPSALIPTQCYVFSLKGNYSNAKYISSIQTFAQI